MTIPYIASLAIMGYDTGEFSSALLCRSFDLLFFCWLSIQLLLSADVLFVMNKGFKAMIHSSELVVLENIGSWGK